MVHIEHLNKFFGKQHVLRDVSLHIEQGEIVGLLGPNGAGKSTLMKILIGLWKPAKGHTSQASAASGDTPNAVIVRPERIGYLPEQNPLYEEMYVREYLRFMARLVHAEAEVDTLMERVGLLPEAHKHIRELSKGYRQRVGLAAAMLGNPELLILDEPTTGLDPNQLDEIRKVIRDAGQSRTVILSTHILQEVKEMCSRVVIINHGQIRLDKPIREIENLEEAFREATKG